MNLTLPLFDLKEIRIARKNQKVSPNKHLNNMDGAEWIKFTKSWFILDAQRKDKDKIALHPATFPEELVEEYLEFFTKPGESVIDPFLGSGTTLQVAEEMGREGAGIELVPEFAEFASNRTTLPIHTGNCLKEIHNTEIFADESFHYAFTSPPYWNILHKGASGNKNTRHEKRKKNKQSLVYSDKNEDLGNIDEVDEYMSQIVSLCNGVHRVLKPKRYLTVIIQNLNHDGKLVPIAWNLGIELAKSGLWKMKGEKIWCKDQGKLGIYGYPTAYATNNVHVYCLTFQRI